MGWESVTIPFRERITVTMGSPGPLIPSLYGHAKGSASSFPSQQNLLLQKFKNAHSLCARQQLCA